ncbi:MULTISPECIES: hypothetical protein [Streptomyces]|uniref:hypothetical protein n=1 Tax=Streptomyces TaxID=1883 RepID=UPI00117FE1B4|nr:MULTISPECIES: hypothetical protein [Streptomyces]
MRKLADAQGQAKGSGSFSIRPATDAGLPAVLALVQADHLPGHGGADTAGEPPTPEGLGPGEVFALTNAGDQIRSHSSPDSVTTTWPGSVLVTASRSRATSSGTATTQPCATRSNGTSCAAPN